MKSLPQSSDSRCRDCVEPVSEKNQASVELIADTYRRNSRPWYLGFSGGKDSSALLALTYAALARVGDSSRPVTVLYCDTGVEIPVVSAMVHATLRQLGAEAHQDDVPLQVKIVVPEVSERYFVKVIGRGYPTPTNKFRWCTDRLRIQPVQGVIGGQEALVALGVRRGESEDRDRTLKRHSSDSPYLLRQSGYPNTQVFAPLLDYDLSDVWSTLHHLEDPRAIDSERLSMLYKSAGADCPIIKDPRGTPCGKGRFGCWTCTVVRKDRAVSGLIADGMTELQPLLDFRNWLAIFRDDPAARCVKRRNGARGPGPFTLPARKEILRRLLDVQQAVPWKLLSSEEQAAIKDLWCRDEESSVCGELCHCQDAA